MSTLIYNIGIHAYAAAVKVAACRIPKAKKMIAGHKTVLQRIAEARNEKAPDGFDVWFHAASLGEFEQARPMIEKLKRERPQLKILLTFFSPSGYEVRKNYDKADAVAYLPFDMPKRVRKFLDAAAPKMAIFVKYEFWANYLNALKRRGTPTYIISAIFRPSQIFFKPHGGFMRNALRCFDHLFVQDQRSKQLLQGIGLENVTVAGDTRFDRVTDIMQSTVHFPIIEDWIASAPEKKVIIAGSSWQPDEAYYIPYLNSHPQLRCIIAPHEFDGARLKALQEQLQGKSVLFSEAEKAGHIDSDTQCVIVDSFGKLSSLYRYGDIAIIGGGFGAGIHNINEAAVYGMPVIFGPKHEKFKEASDLIECKGAFEYTDANSIKAVLDALLDPTSAALADSGKAAEDYIRANLGATELIYSALFGSQQP